MIVLGLLAGAWWGLLVTEAAESRLFRSDASSLTGPDWDARAPGLTATPWGSEIAPEPYPRALRQARGVGRRRSMDLARYFQEYGREAPPNRLYGVGETTAAAVAGVLRRLDPTISRMDRADPEDPP